MFFGMLARALSKMFPLLFVATWANRPATQATAPPRVLLNQKFVGALSLAFLLGAAGVEEVGHSLPRSLVAAWAPVVSARGASV